MSKIRPPYPPEFRDQMVELVRTGRSPEELAREFEPSAQAIRNWVAQVDRDEGRRTDGLTSAEREEMRRLRRENRACMSACGYKRTSSRPKSTSALPPKADVSVASVDFRC